MCSEFDIDDDKLFDIEQAGKLMARTKSKETFQPKSEERGEDIYHTHIAIATHKQAACFVKMM